MKRIALSLFLFIMCAMCWAQSEKRSAAAEEQHLQRVAAMAAQDYPKAVEAGEKELQLLRQQPDCTDSLQIDLLTRLGLAYEEQSKLDRSIAVTQEGIGLCRKTNRENSSDLAVLYSNMAYFYSLLEKKQEALDYSKKSADIFLRLMTNDRNMAISLMRAAECSYGVEKYDDALLYQENACRILSQVRGRHSKDYLKGLNNLIACYKAVGMAEKEAETEALKTQLTQENKVGYVPMAADLSTGEKCRQHNEDAYYASLYYQQHPFSADSMHFVSKYIYNFVVNSEDVHVLFGVCESKWLQDEKAYPYLIGYMSGYVTYQLNHPEDKISLEAYKYGVAVLLACYSNNRSQTGELPALEELLNSCKKDKDKFWKNREKDYKVFVKADAKGQTSKGDTQVIDF